MKKIHFVKIGAFTIVMLGIFLFLSDFMNVNNASDAMRLHGFYKEPKGSIDMTVIGASDIYKGYIAPLAYEEGGFTSYPVTVSAMPASLFLPVLKECQRVQSPNLYVIEINGVFYEEEKQLRESLLRQWFDNIPMSDVKEEGIKHLVLEEDRQNYFLNFRKYHSNWDRLPECYRLSAEKNYIDEVGYSYMKGFVAANTISPVKSDMTMVERTMTESGEKYLRELLEYCKAEKMDNVVFVRWPHRNQYELPENYERIEQVIGEYGYDFINFSEHAEDIGIDPSMDFSDNEHLNPIGAKKMTEYFAKYMSEHYDVEGKHEKDVKERWDECAKRTSKYLDECIEITQNNDGRSIWQESKYAKLLLD